MQEALNECVPYFQLIQSIDQTCLCVADSYLQEAHSYTYIRPALLVVLQQTQRICTSASWHASLLQIHDDPR